MLSDFFRKNFPYGIAKKSDGKWVSFNRDSKPLQSNNLNGKVNEKLLLELTDDASDIQRDAHQNITKIFLYSDKTDPMRKSKEAPELWKKYCLKMKKIID